ncbi:hypothetical protein [Burkholderia ambifaria]|uniref:hypothetical protein n=1 Tax=Burkholderia ambifaria TaxID=152480 RepID=UPI00130DC242|nr:hypothetical protein [Burkholderia ambifaria]MBR7934246.1 hypothetical protein [Burkholderia ambifaria]QQC04605.1 hypothetical protein I6H84_01450 [Burkholderia ambifaria]UZU04615.1 hypothetical protein OR987_30795 [Burkholderia ambifaria]UZU11167.1 hypothetical protein OR988_30780 [Burkholderia ambifaria]WDS15048.1 hypothetical protein OR984_30755 [Burkholderia ambifaria]
MAFLFGRPVCRDRIAIPGITIISAAVLRSKAKRHGLPWRFSFAVSRRASGARTDQ